MIRCTDNSFSLTAAYAIAMWILLAPLPVGLLAAEYDSKIPETEMIPLDEVWAHMMPGTKKIQELEKNVTDDNRLMAKIGKILSKRIRQQTGPAFAVEGKGLEALKKAYEVFNGNKERPKTLNNDNEISIVFFTHYSNYYVHLSSVGVYQDTIRIKYSLVPHRTQNMTMHFALIPIGKLSKGKYSVEITAEALDQKLIENGFKEPNDNKKSTIASSSFKFEVI